MTPWIFLTLAGLFEVGFTTFMKLSNGFKHIPYTVGFAVCAIASVTLLSRATNQIPLGTAYAVWTGIGAFGTAVVGILFFNDPPALSRVFFLSLLIFSIIGLKVVSAAS